MTGFFIYRIHHDMSCYLGACKVASLEASCSCVAARPDRSRAQSILLLFVGTRSDLLSLQINPPPLEIGSDTHFVAVEGVWVVETS